MGGKELVERVPSHTLNIVRVLGDFTYNGAVRSVVYPRGVVSASSDDILAVRAPREVVHFAGRCACNQCSVSYVVRRRGAGGRLPYDDAGTPVFFLVLLFFHAVSKVMNRSVGGRPNGEHPIVSGGRDKFTCETGVGKNRPRLMSPHTIRTEAHNIDRRSMLAKSG